MSLKSILKPVIASTVFPVGSVRTVLFGPCRGLKYRIFSGYALAYLYGGREPAEMRAMVRLLKPGSVAYELGANYGMHTLLMARLVGPAGSVFAFEPVPEIFAALGENVRMNNFQNTVVVQRAVAQRPGLIGFDLTTTTATGHLSECTESFSVTATTLDEYVLELSNPAPTFMKIDVEGAESRVLEGGLDVLSKHRPDLMIELHTPEQDCAVGRILQTLGYNVIRVGSGVEVENLCSGWPDPKGMWGTVVARTTAF